jgi:phosphohistidine swiveling domain-containing protein
MIAEDRGWLGRTREAIRSGLTAEAAVAKIQNDTRARMNQIADPYIRERLQDLTNLAYRLIEHLSGGAAGKDDALPEKIILVARNMGPAELLDYDRSRLCGLVLEEGSETAHVTIVARALEIPLVGQVDGILNRVEPGVTIAIDGDNGEVFLRPDENFCATFLENMNLLESRRAAYADTRYLPAQTRDGKLVSLNFNAGLLLDLTHLADSGADGTALHDAVALSGFRNATGAIPGYIRSGGWAPRHLPDAGYRRRQADGGHAVDGRRGKSGAGLARVADRAGSAPNAVRPASGANRGGGWPAASGHVPHGHRSNRIRRRQGHSVFGHGGN